MITINIIEGFAYLGLLSIATIFSFRKGERSGSLYMLDYLRRNEFFGDGDYEKFIVHMREEEGKK